MYKGLGTFGEQPHFLTPDLYEEEFSLSPWLAFLCPFTKVALGQVEEQTHLVGKFKKSQLGMLSCKPYLPGGACPQECAICSSPTFWREEACSVQHHMGNGGWTWPVHLAHALVYGLQPGFYTMI